MKLFTLILATLIPFVSSYAQPKIYVNETNKITLDTLFPCEFTGKFAVRNMGDKTLEISSIGASCSCTSYSIDKKSVEPNDSAIVEYKIDFRRSRGERNSMIYINSNDESSPKLEESIKAFIYRDLETDPKMLTSYSNLRLNDTVSYKLSLINEGDKPISIKEIYGEDSTHFKIISMTPEDRQIAPHSTLQFEIKASITKQGDGISKLIIPTTSASVPKLEMLVFTNVRKQE